MNPNPRDLPVAASYITRTSANEVNLEKNDCSNASSTSGERSPTNRCECTPLRIPTGLSTSTHSVTASGCILCLAQHTLMGVPNQTQPSMVRIARSADATSTYSTNPYASPPADRLATTLADCICPSDPNISRSARSVVVAGRFATCTSARIGVAMLTRRGDECALRQVEPVALGMVMLALVTIDDIRLCWMSIKTAEVSNVGSDS